MILQIPMRDDYSMHLKPEVRVHIDAIIVHIDQHVRLVIPIILVVVPVHVYNYVHRAIRSER